MNEENDKAEISHQIVVEQKLHDRLEQHIGVLRHIRPEKFKKHDWLIEAAAEMMSEWENEEISEVPKEKRLTIKLNKSFADKVAKIVDYQKKFRSYSKSKWFHDALLRKLEREEEMVQQWLQQAKEPDN